MPGRVSWSTAPYPSELSDREWVLLEPELPAAKPGGRPRSVDLRRILNGICYVLRSGCQWRMLPRWFSPWSTVYAYFRSWRRAGVWDQLQTTLREQVRRHAGREPTPRAAILDTQSVKTTERGGPHGDDGAKKLSGRKRHLLVDTLGLALGALVHPADIQDRASAPWLLRQLQPTLPRLPLIWADSADLGPLQTWVQETFGWRLAIVKRPGGGRGLWLRADQEPPPCLPGFQPAPHRWIVQRSFAWIGRNRRMSQDYEFLPASSEAWIALSMIRLMLKRLAGERIQPTFHYRRTA